MRRILSNFKKLVAAVTILLLVHQVSGQSKDSTFYTQLDFANRWIWRGVSYSETPVIFPMFGYKTSKLNATIFSGYAFERRSYSEVDFIFEYQIHPKVKLGVTDFFGINKDSIGAKHNFFDLERSTTMHMLDFYTILNPLKLIPISFTYSIWAWGADRDPLTLEQRFSQYIEARYDQSISCFTAFAFAGFTPSAGFYANKAAFVNIGLGLLHTYKVGENLTIPLKLEFVLNPELQNTYINAVVTMR